MRNDPKAADLLGLARKILLTELAPLLPSERRYDVLMIAAALAIVRRELEGEGEAEKLELEGLLDYLPAGSDGGPPEDWLSSLNQELANQIREGRHDGDARLHWLLTQINKTYLAESNPKTMADGDDKKS